MSVKLFHPRAPAEAASTQFAATIAVLPTEDDAPKAAAVESFAPDNLATDEPGSNGGMPDVVTDVGGLPAAGAEAGEAAQAPTLSHIGRYALKRQLGAGGLGAVFEAWDPLLSRTVAVKTLHLTPHEGQTQKHALDGLFLNEARAAAGLNHRYIVTIHDAGLSPHGVYIAMERLHGRDLQHALQDGWRPTVEQTVLLVRRIADALAYAHARGVVHCDIKPANIFLQRKDRPKVLDFGIARLMHGSELPLPEGTVAGSPRYRAPEQLTGAPIDARTDLFSLGVVLYELLTGQRAFEGRSLAEIDRAVLQHDPPPAHSLDSSVPLEISAIATRLMARDPAQRHGSAAELASELRRWLATQQLLNETVTMSALPRLVTSASVTTPPGSAPTRHRQPVRWLLGAGLMIGATALALGLGTRGHGGAPAPTQIAAAPLGPQPSAGPGSPSATVGTPSAALATAGAGTADAAAPSAAPAGTGAHAARLTSTPDATATAPGVTTTSPAPPAHASPLSPPSRRTRESTPRTRTPSPAATSVAAAEPAAAARASTGTLILAVSPWGEVEVDGKPAGTTPPLSRLTLPAGSHTVTLRNADFAAHTVQLQIGGDKAVTLRHRFGS